MAAPVVMTIPVGVLDTGFVPDPADPEVTSADCAKRHDPHGTMMASIIRAGFAAGKGVGGAAHRLRLHTCAPATSDDADALRRRRATFDNMIRGLATLLARNVRVVNASLGYNWPVGIRPDDDTHPSAPAARAVVEAHGEMVRSHMAAHPRTVLVASAGNGSGASAVWASPFNWAALGPRTAASSPSPNVIVVEAVDGSGALLPISNRGGMIRAAGAGVPAMIRIRKGKPEVRECPAGTSCAAAHVTGAIARMFAADPALDAAAVKRSLGIAAEQPPPLLESLSVVGCRLSAASRLPAAVSGDPTDN